MVDGIYLSASEIRISKPGADTSSTSLDDFLLHEGFAALELAIGGLYSVTSNYQTIAHNLGYVPTVIMSGMYTYSATSNGNITYYPAYCYADSTNVYVQSSVSLGPPTATLVSGPSIIILGAQGG